MQRATRHFGTVATAEVRAAFVEVKIANFPRVIIYGSFPPLLEAGSYLQLFAETSQGKSSKAANDA